MTRAAVVLSMVLLLGVAHPLGEILRADAPARPEAEDLGAGRLLGSVLTGTFRPLLHTYLWIRADILFGQRRLDEMLQVYRTILRLYPNNPKAREYLGWALAFNLKSEAPDRELAWKWAREGLDILFGLRSDEGRTWVAEWVRKQCGQNAVYGHRYAGPAWEEERWWRARLRGWARERLGEDLGRFELALRLVEDRKGFLPMLLRGHLEELQAYEDLLAAGQAPSSGPRALATLERIAKETADNPPLSAAYARDAATLKELLEGRAPAVKSYTAAMALWGIGAASGRLDLLQEADRTLEALERAAREEGGAEAEEILAPERAAVAAWMRHVERGGPAPPLPLDGLR